LRNSKVADLVAELRNYGLEVHVHDPVVDAGEAQHEYGIALEAWEKLPRAELVVLAVPHRELLERSARDYAAKAAPGAVFVDVKSRFDRAALQGERLRVWRL
jgi:UDP-N-acetyl-D-galactosamine dehydrogenase